MPPFNYGLLTKAGAPTSGVFQVETATVVGVITLAGNAEVILTAAGMAGSPITLSVAVALDDDASEIATKIRAALNANAVIAAFFTIGGEGDDIVLTRTKSAANDGTMNLAIDNDTCEGITGDASSANTTAGVRGDYRGAPGGQNLIDTTNFIIYENTGDTNKPAWSEV